MIEIGIIIGGGFAFFKYAKDHNLLAWFWAIVPAFTYYGGMLVLGLIIGLFFPELLGDRALLTVIALFFGALLIGLAYFIMTRVAKNKAREQSVIENDLLDNEI